MVFRFTKKSDKLGDKGFIRVGLVPAESQLVNLKKSALKSTIMLHLDN
jgi:hypothetical protein